MTRSLQAQIQDLSDWIAGEEIEPLPAPQDFSDGALRAAWRAISDVVWAGDVATFRQRCLALMQPAMAGYAGGPALYERVQRNVPCTVQRPFRSLAEISETLTPVTWLWHAWLPVGMIALLAARPGTGKSMIGLDLAQRIIAGQSWPDGSAMSRPGANVIYVDGEGIPAVHNQRAVAWGMAREHLYFLLADEDDIVLNLSRAAKYQERLEQMAFRLQPALVIVDSLGAVGDGENDVEEVRDLLGYLGRLAQQHATSVLLIHHLRKASSGQTSFFESIDPDQVRGSGHIVAMSRVVWGLTTVQTTAQPDPNGPRRLAVIKSNLARHPKPLGMEMQPLPDGENVRLAYAAEAPVPYHEPTVSDNAGAWLMDYLAVAGEPVRSKDLLAAAAEAGFNRMALYRAKDQLAGKVISTKGTGWSLAQE